ncbi:MAG: phenylalanine--tRNA ligase subunit beta [Planctomycetota bacterium]|jgi:phenylalanyl-tRNA synthetase beta chain
MRLSLRWLGELVDLADTPAEEVARRLTFHTAEVEGVEGRGGGLEGVVTGRVLGVRPHPNADRLRLCTVDTGDGEAREVVCGAPNVAEGQIICYAPEGTTLPNGLTLTKRSIRGVESAGMICAEDELGIGEDHAGIIVLPGGTEVGRPAADALGVADHILEVNNQSITHRPDLWGHVGMAREVAALLRQKPPAPSVAGAAAALEAAEGAPFPIEVEDPEGCRRYVGIVIEGIENGPSPAPLRYRLEALGVRSIDLIVDLTNLVMLEQGQPLHAFDLRDLQGGRIVVRRARDGERMHTLDDVERVLSPEDLVIADGERPVAVAGVMGGQNSEVREDTTAILLESANFDAVRVRRTASRLGLRTEASTRFEKSLDPEAARMAALRFTELILAHVPGARVRSPMTDAYPRPYPPLEIDLHCSLVRRRLGMRVSDAAIRSSLAALGFGVQEVETVLRISEVAPVGVLSPTRPPPLRRLERRLGGVFSLDLGYAETKSYAFYGPRDCERLGLDGEAHLRLTDPSSEEQDRLALTTAPNLLRAVARNQARRATGHLWESTRLIRPRTGGDTPADELRILAAVSWDTGADEQERGQLFLGLVEDVRDLLAVVPVPDLCVTELGDEPLAPGFPAAGWLHPGRRALFRSGDRVLARVGEVAPGVMRAYDLSGRAAHAEISLEAVLASAGDPASMYTAIHRYPVVPFDVAVIVPQRTPAAEVTQTVTGVDRDAVRDVRVFDVYEGEGIPAGHRSIALSCELLDREGTLTTKKADALRKRIVTALEARNWVVRSSEAQA